MKNKDLLKDDDKIDFSGLLAYWLHYWWVFVVCVGCFLGLAFLYLSIKSPTFGVVSSIILSDGEEESGNLGGGLSALMTSFSLGGGTGLMSVEDEVYRMGSHSGYETVVKELGLANAYWAKDGFFQKKRWFYNDSPIVVEIPGAVQDTVRTTKFKMDVPAGGKNIEVTVHQAGKKILTQTYPSFPFMVKTPGGTFRVSTTPRYNPAEPIGFNAVVYNPSAKAEAMQDEIHIHPLSKKSSIVELAIEEVRPDRGVDILNAIVDTYNTRTLESNRERAKASVDFIEERLLNLYNELQDNERKIETYKRDHQIVDAEAEAEYIFKKKETVEGKIVEMETRIGVLDMIIDFLHSEANRYSLIPFTEDIPETPISAYNELVLERMKLEGNPKGNAAALKSLSAQIDAMRANLLTTLDREKAASKIALADFTRVSGTSKNRMEGIPTMERELLALYRDQKIQNTIYAFLLQKREEGQMKYARQISAGKPIDTAFTKADPLSPNKPVILIAAFLLGIVFPAVGLYVVLVWQRHCDRMAEIKEI